MPIQKVTSNTDRHLEPCPFCGVPLFAQWDRPNPKARCRTEGCKGAQLPTLSLDVPEDIAAWNSRPSSTREASPDGLTPIQLSPAVLEFLKEGVESATQCEEADVDQGFAEQLLLLMHRPLYTVSLADHKAVEWGPLVIDPVGSEAVKFR